MLMFLLPQGKSRIYRVYRLGGLLPGVGVNIFMREHRGLLLAINQVEWHLLSFLGQSSALLLSQGATTTVIFVTP